MNELLSLTSPNTGAIMSPPMIFSIIFSIAVNHHTNSKKSQGFEETIENANVRIQMAEGSTMPVVKNRSVDWQQRRIWLQDILLLFSPRTWVGVLLAQSQSVFNQFSLRRLTQAMNNLLWVTVAAKMAIFAFWDSCPLRVATSPFPQSKSSNFMVVTLLSPWSLSAICSMIGQLLYLLPPLAVYWTGRAAALDSAVQRRDERIVSGNAKSFPRYDVYYPKQIEGQDVHSFQEAILILPGFGIDHTAYAEAACQMADAGILTVVASMEPLRFAASPHLGADIKSMSRIMKKVEQDHFLRRKNNKPNESGINEPALRWSLLGHSAGAFGAMRLYRDFLVQKNQKQIRIHKVVLWGCAAMIPSATDLAFLDKIDANSGITYPCILRLQASEDDIVQLLQGSEAEFATYFPKRSTVTQSIAGGTHHGFASYKNDTSSPRYLSNYQQQIQACKATIDFILSI